MSGDPTILAVAKAAADAEKAREAEAALHDAVKGLKQAQESGGKLSLRRGKWREAGA